MPNSKEALEPPNGGAAEVAPKKETGRFVFSASEILDILAARGVMDGHEYLTDNVRLFLDTAEDRDEQIFPYFKLHKVPGGFELKSTSGAKF